MAGDRKIGLVFTAYAADRVPVALKALAALLEDVVVDPVIVVSNNPDLDLKSLENELLLYFDRTEILSHDNTGFEFGAYQAGLDHQRSVAGLSGIIFVNDTYGTHHRFTSSQAATFRSRVRRRSKEAIAIGRIDHSDKPFRIGQAQTTRWVRSHILYVSSEALQRIDRKVYVPEVASLVRGGTDQQAFFAGEISAELVDKIKRWLFTDRGDGWYGAAPLDRANEPTFRRKAQSIVQEVYLSARMAGSGAQLIDVGAAGWRKHLGRLVGKARRIAMG